MTDKRHRTHEEFLAELREHPGRCNTEEKRRRLRGLGESFKRGMPPHGAARKILFELAEDARWDVRQDVAELIIYLDEPDFFALAGKLSEDSNGYVRRSAERSISRRRRQAKEAKRRQRTLDDVTEQMQRLEREYGEDAVAQARELAENLFSIQINRLVHDQVQIITPLVSNIARLKKRLPAEDTEALNLAAELQNDIRLMNQAIVDAESYAMARTHERHPEWFPDVVNQAVAKARENLEEYGEGVNAIRLDISAVPDIRIPMARQLIIQALGNVLKNAMEAVLLKPGAAEGSVCLSGRIVDNALCVEIRDTGHGMDSEELAQRMAGMPCRNPRKKRSSGIGLMNARKNIEAHEGNLEIESTVGEGTVVRITLPLMQTE